MDGWTKISIQSQHRTPRVIQGGAHRVWVTLSIPGEDASCLGAAVEVMGMPLHPRSLSLQAALTLVLWLPGGKTEV